MMAIVLPLLMISITSPSSSSGNLLYLSDNQMLEIPSFTPSTCRVDPHPEGDLQWAVSGLVNSSLMVCGGFSFDSLNELSSCFSLDGSAWVKEASMSSIRLFFAASQSDRGWLVSGGEDENKNLLSSTEFYQGGQWNMGPSLPDRVHVHCQVNIGGQVIMQGGYVHYTDSEGLPNGGGYTNATYILKGSSWTPLSPMKTARGTHSCSHRDGELYVMAGVDGHGYLSSTEVLNLSTGSWRAGPNLPVAVEWGQAANIGGDLYHVGGWRSGGMVLKLARDGLSWEEVGTGGPDGARPVFPAMVISEEGMDC